MLYIGTTGHFGCLGEAELASPEDGALARRLEAIGAPATEVFMEGPCWAGQDRGAEVLRRVLRGWGGRLTLHGPFWDLNLASYRPEVRSVAVGRLLDAVEIAAELEADHLVIHPFASGTPDLDGKQHRYALDSLMTLCDVAERLDVTLVVENMTDRARSAESVERYVDLISKLPPPAGALLDLGHAWASGWDIPTAVRRLGDRLGAVHIHDNHGEHDEHLPVGEGTIPWDDVFPALRTAPADCRWVTEYVGADDGVLREHVQLLLVRQGRTVAA